MTLSRRCQGPLKALALAGVILNCFVLPVQAQSRLLLTKEPQNPKVGQEVTLVLQGAPSQITLCQWSRESPSRDAGEILSFTQFDASRQNSNGSAYTGRETLHQNCSLTIRRLTPQDTGNYTVVIETVAQQSGQANQGVVKVLEASVYLQINAAKQLIHIAVDKQSPKSGESITLTPQVSARQITFCQWSIQPSPGHSKPILNRNLWGDVEYANSEYQDRVTVGEACSLQIKQLRVTDSNNYTVTIGARSQQRQQPQQPQLPGGRDHDQGEAEQEFTGHVVLHIAEAHTGAKGSSASLSYSAGLIAGGLLGSLAWADALGSLFSVLLGSFVSWRPKQFP